MRIQEFSFGTIQIEGHTYQRDVVIDRGEVRTRKKGPSKPLRDEYGHTPLSLEEKIPWNCRRLIVGTGAEGRLPVTAELLEEGRRRHVEITVVPTREAIRLLRAAKPDTNAVLHITC